MKRIARSSARNVAVPASAIGTGKRKPHSVSYQSWLSRQKLNLTFWLFTTISFNVRMMSSYFASDMNRGDAGPTWGQADWRLSERFVGNPSGWALGRRTVRKGETRDTTGKRWIGHGGD